MLCVSCLICSDDGWGYYLLLLEMSLTRLIVWLHSGMLEFFGFSILASCSILIEDMPDCLFKVLIKFCLVRKV